LRHPEGTPRAPLTQAARDDRGRGSDCTMANEEIDEGAGATQSGPAPEEWPAPKRIPPLDELDSKRILALMVRAMSGSQPFVADALGYQHFVNLVRVTDKAVREYELGRQAAEEFVEGMLHGTFSPYFKAIDHFENCVGAAYRAILYIDRLRRLGAETDIETTLLLKVRAKFGVIRGRIEHNDEDIAQGKVKRGSPPFLVLEATGLRFGEERLDYVDLATQVRRITNIVAKLMLQGR
jgi:hypothetical protein